MKIISRNDAKALGLKRFFTGIPCIRGHICQRYVSVASCVMCHHGYFHKWKALNPEKVLKISRSTTSKNRERRTAERVANREAMRAKSRQQYAANKEQWKRAARKWLAKNPDFPRINAHNYRARKLKAGGQHTQADIKAMFKAQSRRCAMPWCRKSLRSKYHIDHIIPLASGGTNYPNNLQLLCPTCNLRKNSKDPIKFSQENGFLL